MLRRVLAASLSAGDDSYISGLEGEEGEEEKAKEEWFQEQEEKNLPFSILYFRKYFIFRY